MNTMKIFRDAQKLIWQKRGLVGTLYIANILIAATLTLPISGRLQKLARTALANKLIEGFTLDYGLDFLNKYSDSLNTLFVAAFGVGVLYLILNTFFAGGILAVLSQEKHFTLKSFLQQSGKFFGRFFRLFLLSGIVLFLFGVVFQIVIAGPLGSYAKRLEPDGSMRMYLFIGFLALLLIGFWNMLFDYAKIAICSRDLKSVFKGMLSGMGFGFRYFGHTVALYYLNFAIVIGLFVVYLAIESLFANSSAAQTYGLLAIQQIFIISRLWMKVSFFGSQQLLYFERRPEEAIQLAVAASY